LWLSRTALRAATSPRVPSSSSSVTWLEDGNFASREAKASVAARPGISLRKRLAMFCICTSGAGHGFEEQ
jgi:hypothetical protein